MSLTESNMLSLATKAPVFELNNVIDNKPISSEAHAKDKPLMIAFICNHCPYVKHMIDKFVEVANEYEKKNIAFIAISSNDVENYPEDAPRLMKSLMEEKGFSFPYCYDETQAVAEAYKAACTPDLYLFDKEHKLVYRGQFDNSRPGSETPVTGKDLISAMDNLLAGKSIDNQQKPSMGCNIKWK